MYFYTAAQNVPIHFDEVQCTGAERSLGQCNFITDHDCDHNEDAGVICIGNLCVNNILIVVIHQQHTYTYLYSVVWLIFVHTFIFI